MKRFLLSDVLSSPRAPAGFILFVQIIVPILFISFLIGCGGSTPSSPPIYGYPDEIGSHRQQSSYSGQEIKGATGDVFVSPKARDTIYWKVAVMMFKAPQEIIGASISDTFATELLKTYKYELVERSQIEQVLDEQVLSLKGVTDSQLAMRIGKILGVDGVIVGTVPEYGLRQVSYTELPSVGINVRMIDVQTGTIVWSVSNSAIAKQPVSLSAFARDLIKSTVANLLMEQVRAGDTVAVHMNPPVILNVEAGIRENVVKIRSNPNDGYTAYNILRSRKSDGPYRKITTQKKSRDKTVLVYTDKDLLDAESYYYKAAGLSFTGLTSLESEPVSVTTAGAPENVSYFQAESGFLREVPLSWSPTQCTEVKGYAIYRSTSKSGPYKQITFIKGKEKQEYVDKGKEDAWSSSTGILNDKTEYFYKIRTVNIVDVESPDSEIVSAVTMGPPEMLKRVIATGGIKQKIKLSWEPMLSDVIKGYVIYRSKSSNGPFEKIDYVSGRKSHEYTDDGSWETKLFNNTEYFYKIHPINIVDVESPDADVVSAVTKPVPQAVDGLQASQGEARQVTLSWQPNPENDIRRYEVYRGESPQSIEKRIERLDYDKLTYTDKKLEDGMTYYYKVRALDRDDLIGDFSEVVSARTKLVPRPPTGLTASYKNGEIILSWEKNQEDDIVRYEVFTGSSFSSKVGETMNTTFQTTEDVKPGKILRYKIKAVDSTELESGLSVPASVTVPE